MFRYLEDLTRLERLINSIFCIETEWSNLCLSGITQWVEIKPKEQQTLQTQLSLHIYLSLANMIK